MKVKQKKGIWLSDILLIIIACFVFGILIYQIATARTLIKSIEHCMFLIASVLFIYRGYLLNKLRKKRNNLQQLNFFEYYEEEFDWMMKNRTVNIQMFLPLFKKEKNKELDKFRQKTNLLAIVMYGLLITSVFIN